MRQTGTVGIVGGGQLGRMLTEAALKLGFRVAVVDPGPNCPAAQAGAEQIVGNFYDAKALRELAGRSDYLTIEIEHIDAKTLAELAAGGKPVNPAAAAIELIQDKLRQNQFLSRNGIPVADFMEVSDRASAARALQAFGGQMVIKTRRGGYDGRGNAVVKDTAELDQALAGFRKQPLYAERLVPFKKELAVMVARDSRGKIASYPVTETIHERNVCVETLTPAEISAEAARAAEQVARDVAGRLEGAGVFGIEMFLTDNDRILVNEIAPRVHNSGHYTIEACATSQFEQHIRAVTGMALGPTELKVPAAVMVNILGERDGPTEIKGLEQAAAEPHTTIHMYGKSPTKVDRKMGHVTATGDSLAEARQRAEQAGAAISV